MGSGVKWVLAGAVVAVAVILHCSGGPEAQVRSVHVKQGRLTGLLKKTQSGVDYLSFQGVPYGAPPVGELRFKPPREAQPWQGEHQAFQDGASCMQVKDTKFKQWGLVGMGQNVGAADMLLVLSSIPRFIKLVMSIRESEDCLFLNVYTPVTQLPTSRLRPVLFFIHGGGFVRGSAHSAVYGPEFLMPRDLVLVTFNYRLGPFGFLSTNTSDAPGNVGLWDQNLALRWVRDNIKNFGGDPDRITIYGESAGSASVHLHVLSPVSRGLFQAAIMSSSSALSSYVMSTEAAVHSERLARSLGAAEDVVADPARRVRFIRGLDSNLVRQKYPETLTDQDKRQIITKLPFGPVVENCSDGEEHFLCENPNDILREGRYHKVPMIIGTNTHEGTLIHALDSMPEVLDKINSDVTTLVPSNLYTRLNGGERQTLGRRIKEYYIRPEAPNDTSPLYDVYGDVMITHGVHVATKWQTAHSTPAAPVYVYRFSADIFAFYKFIYGIKDLQGPGHADELASVFDISGIMDTERFPNKDLQISTTKKMTGLIASFVHQRKPVLEDSGGMTWPAATPGKNQYLEFDADFEIKTDLLKDRMKFWDTVYRETTKNKIYA